jgi:hypothetical protein
MITEDDIYACGHAPDFSEIQCTKCKYRSIVEWEGKKINAAGKNNCKKHISKPKGILFPIKQSAHDRVGIYTKCEFYELDETAEE